MTNPCRPKKEPSRLTKSESGGPRPSSLDWGNLLKNLGVTRVDLFFLVSSLVMLTVTFTWWALAKGISPLARIVPFLSGWLFADFFCGLYHWLLDNFSWRGVPTLERQAHLFQEHHKTPYKLTDSPWTELSAPASYAVVPTLATGWWLIMNGHVGSWFLGALFSFVFFSLFSQVFHMWSHLRDGDRKKPRLAILLQRARVIVTTKHHMSHHRAPFDRKYCIVSGHMDQILDRARFWLLVEKTLHLVTSIVPNNWTERLKIKSRSKNR